MKVLVTRTIVFEKEMEIPDDDLMDMSVREWVNAYVKENDDITWSDMAEVASEKVEAI